MSDVVLRQINALWYQKCRVEKLPIPFSFPKIDSPLTWALDLAKNDPYLISTAMSSALKSHEDDNKMIYVSRAHGISDKVKSTLLDGLERGAAIQLQVDGLRLKYPPIGHFLKDSLAPALTKTHPFGYMLYSSLWITGPGHQYNVHCDLGDHLLLQLHGKKTVRFWGPAPHFDASPLFNFDFRNDPTRFEGPSTTVTLEPGEMVYFSRGVMHEVSVPEQDTRSVSVSIAADYLYPVLTLIDALNQALNATPTICVQPKFTGWDKFSAYLFDPTKYKSHFDQSSMPSELQQTILDILSSETKKFYADELIGAALNTWWANYSTGNQYSSTGILPASPQNKYDVLKEWESERLRG